MGGPDSQRNPRVTFQKRCKTLKEKAHQLSDICGAKVYLLIVHDRENYVYNSSYDPSWPPADELLEMLYTKPKLVRKTFNEMKGICTPPRDPQRLKQYFAARHELYGTLEDLHKTMGLTFLDVQDETNSSSEAES